MDSNSFNDNKLSILNKKYGDLIKKNPEWVKVADRRNKAHIKGVQTFANRIGREYPNHDDDKFEDLYIPYVLMTIGYNRDLKDELNKDEEMDDFITWASFKHVTRNHHHPEHWDIPAAIKNDSVPHEERENQKYVVIDATKMPNEYLEEMCCDWASVGAENGNSPQSWFKEGLKKRWKFTKEQEEFIWETLERLWPGGKDETSEVKHEERFFNKNIWDLLNSKWDEYDKKQEEELETINESFNIPDDFEKMLTNLLTQRDDMSQTVKEFDNKKREPVVELPGVGSLQAISFLFSPDVTNYIMTLLDSLLNKDYKKIVNSNEFKKIGLDKIEFGKNFNTKAKITNHFAKGLLKSLNLVNMSKLRNKTLLATKLYVQLKKHAKTIKDRLERKEYLEDVKSFLKVIDIIKNIVKNRDNFINVLGKTLIMQEDAEIISESFVNICDGI